MLVGKGGHLPKHILKTMEEKDSTSDSESESNSSDESVAGKEKSDSMDVCSEKFVGAVLPASRSTHLDKNEKTGTDPKHQNKLLWQSPV